MPCIIALIVFGIMGIFSASHRSLAKEAFSCVFKRVTFRPCDSNFKEKIKSKILSKLINRSVFLTKLVNKNYELLSWVFFILVIGSTIWVLRGGYNFYIYGSCNGLNQSGFCAFDPHGENNKTSEFESGGATCGIVQNSEEELTLENVDLSIFPQIINLDAKKDIVFIGCYDCDYSIKAYPLIKKLISKEKVNYIFAHYPAKNRTEFLSEVGYLVREIYGTEKFWELNDYLFSTDKDYIINQDNLKDILEKFNIDFYLIKEKQKDPRVKEIVQKEINQLQQTGIFGTPTIFIEDKVFVGPKPYRVYRSAVNNFIFF